MGARDAFLRLPDPWAVETLTALVQNQDFEILIGALKAMDGDIKSRLELGLAEAYNALRSQVFDEIETLEMGINQAPDGSSLPVRISELRLKLARIGKADVVEKLEELHPDLASFFNGRSEKWQSNFWKRDDLKDIPQNRGYPIE